MPTVALQLWADAAKTQPVDLTGCVAAAQVRTRPGASITNMDCEIAAK